jgi:predicted DNA-binding transcriptional regulator YafY
MEQRFTDAIHSKNKVKITYFSKKDKMITTRICAPLDIGLHKGFPDRGDYYHVWDYDGSKKPHYAPLKSDQIRDFEVLDETFDPADFVTWNTDWTISRDWGHYS